MPPKIHSLIVVAFLFVASLAQAESPGFNTAIGTIEKFDKAAVTITLADKSKKSIELTITGTSHFSLFAPQLRSGKTVITQRKAEAADLTKGQSIAVIYAEGDKEYVLLNAVLKPIEKPVDKPADKPVEKK